MEKVIKSKRYTSFQFADWYASGLEFIMASAPVKEVINSLSVRSALPL